MVRRCCFLLAGLLCATSSASWAQVQVVMGNIPAGKGAAGIAERMEASWNQGDFSCSTGSPTLVVVCHAGACEWRAVHLFFEILEGSATCEPGSTSPCTSVPHDFDYHVDGSSGVVLHSLSFDNDPLLPINSGTFDFEIDGGDRVRVSTIEGPYMPAPGSPPLEAPALGLAGILAGVLVVGAGAAWWLRGSRA